jgi:DNA-binding HxlR family transcriptional regulator
MCPSRKVLELIGDRWTLLVIAAVSQGVKRHNQLIREVEGISQKMLTQTLRKLERNGIVARKVYPVIPPMVEYSLTPLGQTLIDPVRILGAWAEEHFSEVELARAWYDRAAGAESLLEEAA